MKKIFLLAVAVSALISCEETPLSQYTALKIESPVTSLYVGQTAQLTYKAEPADVKEAVVWTSGDDKILFVDQKGAVKGLKEGTATVTLAAKADPKIASSVKIAVVTDPNPTEVTGVSIFDGETKVGQELTLTLAGTGEELFAEKEFEARVEFSEEDREIDKTVTWELASQNPEGVFTLSDAGVFTAKGRGVAVIKATANAAPSVSATLTVRAVAEGDVTSLEIVDATGYAFADNSLMLLESGEGVGAQVFVYPETAAQTAVWSAGSDRIQICDSTGTPITDGAPRGSVKIKAVPAATGGSETGAETDPLTVTVTVTQTGLEPVTAELPVRIIDPAATLGGYADAWIQGEVFSIDFAEDMQPYLEVVSVTASSQDAFTISDNQVTIGNPAESATLTVAVRTVPGGETGSSVITGQIYDSTHLRYDATIFGEIKRIDFAGTNAPLTQFPVGVELQTRQSGFQSAQPDHYSFTTEGLQIPANVRDAKIVVTKADSGLGSFQIMGLTLKWTNGTYKPNFFIGANTYGYVLYKKINTSPNTGFLQSNKWTIVANAGATWTPTVGDWNTFRIYEVDNKRASMLNNGDMNRFDSFSPSSRFDAGTTIGIALQDDSGDTEGQLGNIVVRSVVFYNPVTTN